MRIWQANIGKTIVAHVPISAGQVQETGDFELDGVTFPAAEIQLEFLDPADEGEGGGAMFPTGNLVDELDVPGVGTLQATLINAGIPTIFLNAADLGYTGTELQGAINDNRQALAMFETIRAHGAVCMGLITHIDQAGTRQHTPKVAFVAPPQDYVASSGKSHRRRRHRPAGARAVDGQAAPRDDGHGRGRNRHGRLDPRHAGEPGRGRRRTRSGALRPSVRHPARRRRRRARSNGEWTVTKAVMSRSARVLMEGWVRVPDETAL